MANRTKLAVLLHADVVGSTALVQKHEQIAHDRMQDAFRRFSETISSYGGMAHELRGDALVAEFGRASDAVCAALAFQVSNSSTNAAISDDIEPVVRVGIGMGEVIIADGTVTGTGVVLSQRLEQLAEPGGVVVQGANYETIPRRFPFSYDFLGEQQLKGFDEPVRAYSVRLNEGANIPAPEQASGSVPSRGSELAPQAVIGDLEPVRVEKLVSAALDKPSIAVLPFSNLSRDPDQEYFSDGITEDIITALSRMRWFRVIARNSTFVYKDKPMDIRQVARDLDVRYVLEGSVRKAGNRIRVSAQLVEGAKADHVWAKRYDRDLDDIFEVQDELTQTVVAAIEPELSRAERERGGLKRPQSLNAWDLHQRGMWHFHKRTKQDYVEAEWNLRHAIELDDNLDLAYAGLAETLCMQSILGFVDSPADSLAEAVVLAQRSVAIDAQNPLAHAALGTAYNLSRQPEKAVPEFEIAIELNPSSANNHYGLGVGQLYSGEFEAAIDQLRIAIDLSRYDPYTSHFFAHMAQAYLLLRRYEETVEWARRALRQPSAIWPMAMLLASAFGHLGRTTEAAQAIDELIRLNSNFSERLVRENFPNPRLEWQDHILSGLRKGGWQG